MPESRSVNEHPIRNRGEKLLARVRQRQLFLARRGRVTESFDCARRANRIRRTLGEPAMPL